jgi:hypothetical protein
MLRIFLGFVFDSFIIYMILWMVFSLCEVLVPVWVMLFFALMFAGLINEDFDKSDTDDDKDLDENEIPDDYDLSL